ncbi:uncharacterized protein LOC115703226 isoform X2 [Cannabis sativa]|uniref:uncharacterized protein LOC115703226 isoform X2 n=1 Tax=Cannabis sativa TaxID=3483 RepID=UPI0029CA5D34|nr:uncharacterized protein LOC115703226 isoform X2 [Cannabis sativa]
MATLCLNLTIQVLNLSPATTSDDLIDFFSYCGMVENVKLLPPRCKDDKEGSQSAALVTFRQPYAFKTALLLNELCMAMGVLGVEEGVLLSRQQSVYLYGSLISLGRPPSLPQTCMEIIPRIRRIISTLPAESKNENNHSLIIYIYII